MLSSLFKLTLVSTLAVQSSAAPAGRQEPSALKAREKVKARQNSPAINPADNVWPQATGGPIVLDLPDGQGADPAPSVTGSPVATTNLAGNIGLPVSGDARVPSPSLIPAQSANAKDGLIFDFEPVPTPQPIRGTTGQSGGTDDEALGTSPVYSSFTGVKSLDAFIQTYTSLIAS